MNCHLKKTFIYHLAGIFFVAFLMTAPLWIYGMPDPDDALRHFQFANSVYDSLSRGDLYVQGEPNLNHGYGGVALRFYPPFTYYLLAAAHLLTQDWYNAAFLFFWMVMAASGVGAYLLAREWLSGNFAFLAALLYILDSFHNSQIQLTYAYAEFVAGALLTFCFLFAARTIRRGNLADIAGLALSFGLLLLTHIPLSMIGSFCLLLFCLCSFDRKSWRTGILKLAAGVSLGALAASFHWARIFTETQWINHSSPQFLTEGAYNYQNFFVNVRAVFFPGDLIFLNFLIFLVPSLFIQFLKPNAEMKRRLIPIMTATLFSIFMATSFSQAIWEIFPTLQKIQFPWRWLTVTSIGAAILIAAGAESLKTILSGRKSVLILWAAVCILTNGYFTVSYIIGSNLMDKDYFLVQGEKFNREVGEKATAPHQVFWQTIWAKNSAFALKNKVEAAGRDVEILKWEGFDKEFKVSAGAAPEARIAQFYYPHWQAEVNGARVAVSKTDDGAILIPLPDREATIRLTFVEPFAVKFFITVSAFAWLAMLALFLVNLRNKFHLRRPEVAA